jgi:beta-N-acetylhexosaminidase
MRQEGSLLFIGVKGAAMTPPLRQLLKRVQPGGIVLFERNLRTPAALRTFLSEIRKTLDSPPFIAVDQEGGPVNRLRAFSFRAPSAWEISQTNRPALAERQGSLTGRALRLLGVNVNFAPVLDLSPPEAGNGIGVRSFSTQPDVAARFAAAFLRGLKKERVLGCLKHFPGLGASSRDSHRVLPTVRKSRRRLLAEDVSPFARLSGRAPFLMVGHGYYPAFSKRRIPADLDPAVGRALLRGRFGYRGIVLSDDLAMCAVPEWARRRRPEAFLRAGCDMLLICRPGDVEPTAARLREALARCDAPLTAHVRESLKRIARLKRRLPPPPGRFSARAFEALRRKTEILSQ